MKYHSFNDLNLNDLEVAFKVNENFDKLLYIYQDIETTKLCSTCIKGKYINAQNVTIFMIIP